MPKTKSTPAEAPRSKGHFPSFVRRIIGRKKTADWHWFDHPEMQARIAEAEAERAAGHGKRFNNRDEAMAYLDSL